MDFSNMEEIEVIMLAQSGEEEARAFLLEKYKGMVRYLARPLFLMDGDQDDLLQEGMIGLFKAVCTYKEEKGSSFRTYANTCIMSQLYSAIKKSNRKKNIPLNSYISIYAPSEDSDMGDSAKDFVIDNSPEVLLQNPEDIIIGQENAKHLQEKLYETLSVMEKEVLKYYLSGMTYHEIAERMGKTSKTIDNALQRIKGKMSKLCEKT